jgi:ribose transport system ATP-binding protein
VSDAVTAPTEVAALAMTGVTKVFGQAKVLDDVTFRVNPGRIHGLVGHNGAGKSTLMKIALGAEQPTEGKVVIGGTTLEYARPAEAREAGVGMVLQELSLIPTLSVADNIFLNDERRGRSWLIAHRTQRREARRLLAELGISGISPRDKVGDLGIAQQQMVEIAKAFRLGTTLLILDEPTAPLSRREVLALFELIRQTASLGRGVVFITHHLREVFEVCNEVTVLREGKITLSRPTSETSLDEVVLAIVGGVLHKVEAESARPPVGRSEPLLGVRDLTVGDKLIDVSFDLHPGEIVGIAGLAGSGRTVLLKTLFGEIRPDAGAMTLRGRRYRPKGTADAIRRGLFLIPEDRRVHGVVLMHSIEQNVILSVLPEMSDYGWYRPSRVRRTVDDMMRALDIKATGPQQLVSELSGGNQQKVVFSKALVADTDVLLLDEPTFGVDVHTAAEVIRLIRSEVERGKTALWVSSDLPELLHVSNRVLVLADGRIKSVVHRDDEEFTEDAMLRAIQREGAGLPTGTEGGP